VRITNTKLVPYALPLKGRWKSHSGSLNIRCGHLLEIEDHLGHVGYGDCAPLPSHGTETAAEALKALEPQLSCLANLYASDALKNLPDMYYTPAARCAIETALLDLTAKQQETPLHTKLNPRSKSKIKVNANIGMLDEGLSDRIATAIEQGYSVLKIKIGVSKPNHELDLLNTQCSNLPNHVMLRLDANRAWDFATSKLFLNEIRQMPIESLEEPLAKPDINTLKQLQCKTDITLALDESIVDLGRENLSQLDPIHRIILKPMVLGGVIPALHFGQRANDMGVETVVTTSIDSSAGVWMATHLAAALDLEGTLCHGLATSGWLQRDLGAAPYIEKGNIDIPHTPGLGFVPLS
jgi:o-succinylbenzoate synthase